MSKLPSKKVIWLVIVLVVITISVFWYVGYKDRKEKEVKLAQYTKEFLDKQKNIEAVAIKGLLKENPEYTTIEPTPKITIATTTTSSTEQLSKYKLALIEALKPLNIIRKNEPNAVLEAVDKNNPSLLISILESKVYHQSAAKNLSQIVVPKELALQHKKMISDLNFLIAVLGNMSKATEQPQLALNNSQSFLNNYPIFLTDIDNLNNYFEKQGTSTTPTDKIKVFVSYTQ